MFYISCQIWPTKLCYLSLKLQTVKLVISWFGTWSQFPRNEVFLAVSAFAFSVILSPLWLLRVKIFSSHHFSVSMLIAQHQFLRLKYEAL